MNEIMESIQPQLNTVVSAIIAALVTIILALVAVIQKKVITWINSKTSANQREMVYKLASEAFAIAESAFRSEQGKAKLNYAYSYTSELLVKKGIKISDDEIKAAIEKAVLEYNLQKK